MSTSTDTRESHFRSVLRAITYRIIGSITTGILAYTVTRDNRPSLTIIAAESLFKTIVYFLHERPWQPGPRGSVRSFFRRR